MTTTTVLDPLMAARDAQVDYAWEQNELRCRSLKRLVEDTTPLPENIPLAYDDWMCDDRLAWFAVFAVYTYECHREGKLRAGKGPFYCSGCEEPQEGWQRLHCWECAWPRKIRGNAIDLATNWRRLS